MERRPGNSRFKVGGEERKKRGRGGERMGSGSSRYLDGMGLDWIVRRKYVLVPELVRPVKDVAAPTEYHYLEQQD